MYLLAILFHELGHLLAIYCFRQRIVSVTLNIGGLDIRRYGGSSYVADAVVAISGPLLGYFAGCLGALTSHCDFFLLCSVYSAVNILPVYPLDGGCFLRAMLLRRFSLDRATGILRCVSVVTFCCVYAAAVMLLLYTEWNASLLVICIFIFSLTFLREKL